MQRLTPAVFVQPPCESASILILQRVRTVVGCLVSSLMMLMQLVVCTRSCSEHQSVSVGVAAWGQCCVRDSWYKGLTEEHADVRPLRSPKVAALLSIVEWTHENSAQCGRNAHVKIPQTGSAPHLC